MKKQKEHWDKSYDLAQFAKSRITTGMMYGADMTDSRIVTFEDAIALLQEAVTEIKESHEIKS